MSRLASRSLVVALLLGAAALPAIADPTPGYQKRVIEVAEYPGDPAAAHFRDALSSDRRLIVMASPLKAGQPVSSLVASIAKDAGLRGPTYVLVPHWQIHQMQIGPTGPECDSDGKPHREGPDEMITVSASLTLPMDLSVDLLEVPSGRVVKTFAYTETLDRKLSYTYDRRDNPATIAIKAGILGAQIATALTRPPAQAFASEIGNELTYLAIRTHDAIRELPEFKLRAAVISVDGPRDRIMFNLGRNLDVKPDDWFHVKQDGKEIALVKVRALNDTTSEAQPMFYDGTKLLDASVEEDPKANIWHGLKAGGIALNTGFVSSLGYGLQWDVAPAFGGSETYFTTDLGGLSDFRSGGFTAELGMLHKTYWRRWAFSYGGKLGLFDLESLTHGNVVPSGTLALGVDCHLLPELVWTNDLGLFGLWPIASASAPGQVTYPFGGQLRTGLAWVF